jgi:hypothetical protein
MVGEAGGDGRIHNRENRSQGVKFPQRRTIANTGAVNISSTLEVYPLNIDSPAGGTALLAGYEE